MKTASHFTYFGPGRIAISLGAPRGAPAGYRIYRTLAPTRDMLKLGYEAYRPRFFEILAKLDPQREWDHLHTLAAGAEPVLQCFEKPPLDTCRNYCHRRMVAEWFEQHMGVQVPEIGQ